MPKLIDTHCHIHFNAYKNDMDDVIRRTIANGVFMITVGTQKDTSRAGLEVAERYEGLWASVGLHPNHLTKQEFWDDDESERPTSQGGPQGVRGSFDHVITRSEVFDPAYYLELAKHPKCVAIGECGLDFYRIPEDADAQEVKRVQEETVRAHFDVATQADLPVIIHCRDAHDRQAQLIAEYVEAGKLTRRGVVHCFTGTIEEARRYLDLGFYISFTGIITFPSRKNESTSHFQGEVGRGLSPIQRVVQEVPLDRLLIETDSPYLTPIPFRGKRNEPLHVRYVAEKVAEIKGLDVEEVAQQTTQNTKTLFSLNIATE